MRFGIFADTHDHLANIRLAVQVFNQRECAHVLFAGDLVSTFALPPLRQLCCPLTACYGDNEGNKLGLQAGLRAIDVLGEPPFGFRAADGTRFLLAHMRRQLRGVADEFDVCIYGHTHKPSVTRDARGRLFINPGETSGWTFFNPTIAIFESETGEVEVLAL
jgi:putative phosphoesterase